MEVESRLADLRVAVPAAVVWAGTAVLVGVPRAATWVLAAAGLVAGACVVLLVLVRSRAPGAVTSGPSHTRGSASASGSVPRSASGSLPRSVSGSLPRSVSSVSGVVTVLGVVGVVLTTTLLAGLVAVAVVVGDARRSPAVLAEQTGRAAEVEVVLDRDLAVTDRSVLGTLVRLGDAGPLRVPVRLVPAAESDRTAWAAGTRLVARAAVEPDDPGAPTASVVFLRGEASVEPPEGLLAATDVARRAFASVTAGLPEPGGSLLRGLAIGDRGGLDPGTEAAMEASALTHLTAVSGANCAVVVGLVVLLGRAVGLPRGVRVVVAVVLLLAFVVLVRPDPSIVRATVMAVVVLVVHLTGRPLRGVPLIAIAVVGMLVADPWYARSFAFGLSVLATSGIVVLAPPLAALIGRRLPASVAVAVAVPVAAQLACWPLTIPLAAALPTYAVPANLLTEPLAPIVTVVGLAACVLAPVWPSASTVLAGVAWAPATAIGGIAHGAAALPFASLPWPDGVGGVLAASLVSLGSAAAVLAPPVARLRLLLLPAVVTVVGVSVVAVPVLVLRGSLPGDWSVAACDVGQGDAVLVRDGADGPVALVDTGDEPDRLTSCLDLLGISRLDLLVLTHFDRDHVGAVDAVADRVGVALVGPSARPEDDRVVRSLQLAGVDVRRADDRTTGSLGALDWRVLWPPGTVTEGGNDASLVLQTTAGRGCGTCVSVVFLGDVGESSQRRLRTNAAATNADAPGAVGRGAGRSGSTRPDAAARPAPGPTPLGPVDVVKVAHHGSADQDPALYEELRAAVGLIGVGADNSYGHPTPTALAMLEQAGSRAFRTDQDGTVVVARARAQGGALPGSLGGALRASLRVWTERSGSAVARRIDGAPVVGARTVTVDPDPAPPEGPHARQEARPSRREDRPGALVGHPTGAGRAHHRAGDLPRRAGEQRPP